MHKHHKRKNYIKNKEYTQKKEKIIYFEMVILKYNLNKNDEWVINEKNMLFIEKNPNNFLEFRKELKRRNFSPIASLPEVMNTYIYFMSLFEHFFFNNQKTEITNIITDTNEILGIDLEGIVYGKNEKVIVHTHGIFVNSKSNAKSPKSESNILSEEEFSLLLRGKVNYDFAKASYFKVYKEEELKRKRKSAIELPCAIVLRGEKYLNDPGYYCNELEYTQLVSGFEKNGLLISRTLQEPAVLMNFIKEDVNYFRQISPLVEPIILSAKGKENLFRKYAYRVMPLILSDGEINKEANDKIDLLSIDNKQNEKYYILLKSPQNRLMKQRAK